MKKRAVIPPTWVHEYLTSLCADAPHAKRVQSLVGASGGLPRGGGGGGNPTIFMAPPEDGAMNMVGHS